VDWSFSCPLPVSYSCIPIVLYPPSSGLLGPPSLLALGLFCRCVSGEGEFFLGRAHRPPDGYGLATAPTFVPPERMGPRPRAGKCRTDPLTKDVFSSDERFSPDKRTFFIFFYSREHLSRMLRFVRAYAVARYDLEKPKIVIR